MWNMYGLQLAPRSASELQPVLMNTVLSRLATWPMARPDADEISPMIIATLSRSIRRSALAEAVCGLTESSMTSSILRPITPPPALISSMRELDAHHGVFAERSEKAGQRREVADADRIGLGFDDGRHADAGEHRRAGRALDQDAPRELRSHSESSLRGSARLGAATGPDQVGALVPLLMRNYRCAGHPLVQRVFVLRLACRAKIMDRGAATGNSAYFFRVVWPAIYAPRRERSRADLTSRRTH